MVTSYNVNAYPKKPTAACKLFSSVQQYAFLTSHTWMHVRELQCIQLGVQYNVALMCIYTRIDVNKNRNRHWNFWNQCFLLLHTIFDNTIKKSIHLFDMFPHVHKPNSSNQSIKFVWRLLFWSSLTNPISNIMWWPPLPPPSYNITTYNIFISFSN